MDCPNNQPVMWNLAVMFLLALISFCTFIRVTSDLKRNKTRLIIQLKIIYENQQRLTKWYDVYEANTANKTDQKIRLLT